MTSTKGFLRRFQKDEGGATAIEYGLIAALIAVVIITGVTALGGNKKDSPAVPSAGAPAQ